MRDLDDITEGIIDTLIRIHRDLGPGLLETVCATVLSRALGKRGFQDERHMLIRFEFSAPSAAPRVQAFSANSAAPRDGVGS
jgi:hypothetical protein